MYCYTKRDRNKNPGIFPFLFTVFFGLTKDSKKRSYEFYRIRRKKTADAVFILILGEFLYFYTS